MNCLHNTEDIWYGHNLKNNISSLVFVKKKHIATLRIHIKDLLTLICLIA